MGVVWRGHRRAAQPPGGGEGAAGRCPGHERGRDRGVPPADPARGPHRGPAAARARHQHVRRRRARRPAVAGDGVPAVAIRWPPSCGRRARSCRCASPRSAATWPTGWPPRTPRAWCTATSSRATSSSAPTGGSSSPTSGCPARSTTCSSPAPASSRAPPRSWPPRSHRAAPRRPRRTCSRSAPRCTPPWRARRRSASTTTPTRCCTRSPPRPRRTRRARGPAHAGAHAAARGRPGRAPSASQARDLLAAVAAGETVPEVPSPTGTRVIGAVRPSRPVDASRPGAAPIDSTGARPAAAAACAGAGRRHAWRCSPSAAEPQRSRSQAAGRPRPPHRRATTAAPRGRRSDLGGAHERGRPHHGTHADHEPGGHGQPDRVRPALLRAVARRPRRGVRAARAHRAEPVRRPGGLHELLRGTVRRSPWRTPAKAATTPSAPPCGSC